MSKPAVNFIGIGAPKCGTTWIAQCLAEHPQICLSKPKETHHLSADTFTEKEYQTFFRHCPTTSMHGEFTTKYLYQPACADKIKQHYPQAKLIVCLRNPVTRALSNFKADLSANRQTHGSLTEVIAQQPEHRIIKNGFYGRHLKYWLDNFPRAQIKIIVYEKMKERPRQHIQSIYDFLGVDSAFVPPSLHVKINVSGKKLLFNWFNLKKFQKLAKRMKRNIILRQILRLAKFIKLDYLVKKIYKMNKSAVHALENRGWLNQQRISSPQLSPQEKQQLADLYRQDIAQTETLTGLDLSGWLK